MRFRPKFFIYQDLIGVVLYAKSKTNSTWLDWKELGEVVDETKYTLLIQNKDNLKRYVKKNYIFRCWLPQSDGTKILLQFDGTKIMGHPEQRIKIIKKNRRKYH